MKGRPHHLFSAVVTMTLAIAGVATLPAFPPAAAMMESSTVRPREGWVILPTRHDYRTLISRVEAAARKHRMGIVTRASATIGALKVLGKRIPGNMVMGLYHPRFAVPMLEASVAAGIEAPIRIYITENPDGTATLSYRKPSSVFAPYMAEGGDRLRRLAVKLDALFAALATDAAEGP